MRAGKIFSSSVFTVVLSVILLAGCVSTGQSKQTGGASSSNPPNQAKNDSKSANDKSTANQGKKIKINFVTNPVGSGIYTLAVAQAQLVSSMSNVDLVVQPTQGTKVNPDLVGARQADVSNITADTGLNAYKGLDGFKPHPFMRVLQAGHSNVYAFIVRKDDHLQSITDLKGKRLSVDFPGVSLIRDLAELEFKAYGLDLEKDAGKLLKAENTTVGLKDLVEGKTDAVMASLGGGKILEMNSIKPLTVLPFDPSKADIVQKQMGGMSSDIATKENNQWLDKDQPVMGSPALNWAHAELDDNIAYTITKTLVENNDKLISVHSNFKDWTKERAVRKLGFPYHPGAIKYYKEAGLWNNEMENWQSKLLNEK